MKELTPKEEYEQILKDYKWDKDGKFDGWAPGRSPREKATTEIKEKISKLLDDRIEKRLKELIDAGMINYVPLSVQKVGIAEHIDTEEIEEQSEP